jgi:hypothetical protein
LIGHTTGHFKKSLVITSAILSSNMSIGSVKYIITLKLFALHTHLQVSKPTSCFMKSEAEIVKYGGCIVFVLLLTVTSLPAQSGRGPKLPGFPADSLDRSSFYAWRSANIDRMPILKPDLSKVIPMPQLKMERAPRSRMPVYPKPIPRLRFELLNSNKGNP